MRKITIKVIPNSTKSRIINENEKIKVYVKSQPTDGKANKEAIKLIAEFFKVRKKDIKIIQGAKSREKLIEINDN